MMKIKRISLIVTALLMMILCGLGLAETVTDTADAATTADVQTIPPTMGLRVMVGDTVQISDLWGQFFANEGTEPERSYVTLDGDVNAEDDRVSFDGSQVLIKKAGRYTIRFKTSPEEKNSKCSYKYQNSIIEEHLGAFIKKNKSVSDRMTCHRLDQKIQDKTAHQLQWDSKLITEVQDILPGNCSFVIGRIHSS